MGRVKIDAGDRQNLRTQGMMLARDVTTGYLNLLANSYANSGVVRSDSDIIRSLEGCFDNHGIKKGWSEYLAALNLLESGSSKVLWSSDRVLLVQVFWGPTQCGHWALLVFDRSRKDNNLAVYFDSLPSYQPDGLERLVRLFSKTPVVDESYTWIKGEVPMQYRNSMDCGVYASCLGALYVMTMDDDGLLSGEGPKEAIDRITRVEIVLPYSGEDATRIWGGKARAHMCRVLKAGEFDKKDVFFTGKDKTLVVFYN